MTKMIRIYKALVTIRHTRNFTIAALLVLIAAFLCITQATNAQAIGNWNFNGTLSGTPGTFNTAGTADFSPAVPIRTFNGGTEYYGENGWPAGGVNTSMYLQFSLTPLSGYQLDISSLVLTMRRSNTGSPAGSGPTSWSLRSSLDGFSSDIASGSMTLAYVNYTITPGASFVNLYTTVTFRLYGYNVTVGSGGNSRLVFDNIRVNGIGYLLPVRLGTLNAAVSADKVNLAYKIYHTQQNDLYSIERSSDGSSFTSIAIIAENNDAAEKNYSYTDETGQLINSSQLYYRVRLQSSTAADSYSEIVTVKIKNKTASVKMHAVNNRLSITGIFTVAGLYGAAIFSTDGKLLSNLSFNPQAGYNAFNFAVNRPLPTTFIVRLSNARGYTYSALLVNDK